MLDRDQTFAVVNAHTNCFVLLNHNSQFWIDTYHSVTVFSSKHINITTAESNLVMLEHHKLCKASFHVHFLIPVPMI